MTDPERPRETGAPRTFDEFKGDVSDAWSRVKMVWLKPAQDMIVSYLEQGVNAVEGLAGGAEGKAEKKPEPTPEPPEEPVAAEVPQPAPPVDVRPDSNPAATSEPPVPEQPASAWPPVTRRTPLDGSE